MAAVPSLDQFNLTHGDAKLFCNKAGQMFIRLTINGRCRDPDFETIAVNTGKFIPGGARLQVTVQ